MNQIESQLRKHQLQDICKHRQASHLDNNPRHDDTYPLQDTETAWKQNQRECGGGVFSAVGISAADPLNPPRARRVQPP